MYPQPKETIVDAHFEGPARQILDTLDLAALEGPPESSLNPPAFGLAENDRYQIRDELSVPVPGSASRLMLLADPDEADLVLAIEAGGRSVELVPVNQTARGQSVLLVNPLAPEGLLGQAWLAGDKLTLRTPRPVSIILYWS